MIDIRRRSCPRWRFSLIILCAAGLLTVLPAQAHDSPEHEIEHFTARMERQGRTAELLYRRACEYRALGKLATAERDLADALELDAQYFPAQLEIGRLQLAQGKPRSARASVERALAGVSKSEQRAPLLIVRSDILAAQGELEAALEDCEQACQSRPDDVEWLLKRGYLQARLNRHAQRAADLKAAYERSGAAVLKIEWIESLIDSGQQEPALAMIEAELADSRWQSSWLLRRARVRQALGKTAEAADDANAAMREIDSRLNPQRPDGSLLADRGLALALLGEWNEAANHAKLARAAGADVWMLGRLEAMLKAHRTQSTNPTEDAS